MTFQPKQITPAYQCQRLAEGIHWRRINVPFMDEGVHTYLTDAVEPDSFSNKLLAIAAWDL